MSEKLDNLPENPNTKLSQREEGILNKFFGRQEGSSSNMKDSKNEDLKSWKNCLKLTLFTLIILIVLYNPFINGILSGISYFSASPLNLEIFKILVFGITFLVMYKYMFKK